MKRKSEKIVKQVNITEHNKTEEELKQSEEKYRKLVEYVQDSIFIVQDAKICFVNEAFARMIDYIVDEIIGMDFRKLCAPEDLKLVADRYFRRQAGEVVPSEYEFRMLHKDGKTRVFVNVNVGLINYRGKVASIGTLRDITKRKQMEKEQRKLYVKLKEVNKELRELTIIDPNTGLYNFRYLEEAVEREFEYAKRDSHPLSLTIMDIDYFKSINDVYGHQFGDLVLKQLAKQLKGNVRRYDTVIRFGGEEFIIIFPGVDRVEALNLSNKILDAVNSYNFGNKKHGVRLRLSMGVASYPEDRITKATDLLNFAGQILHKVKEDGGNRVYSSNDIKIDKIPISEEEKKVESLKEGLEKVSRRANQTIMKTISTFIKTIDVESVYTVEHAEKVSQYATKISKILNLSENKIDLINLASLLHDIGKIGISRKILFKNGKLTEEGYDRVKKHPEIAVDIIRSIRDFRGIIPIILHHHERWNGKGYPEGLKGEDIPLGARIMAVADVYHALTSNRPYRKAYSKNKAMEIIKNSSGTDFDPKIVEIFLKILREEK